MSEAPSTEASFPPGQPPSSNRRDATERATAAALFRERREDILARWEATLRRSPPAAHLSKETLRDHFPGVLDRLITLLEQGPGGEAEDRSRDVQIHSLDRLRRRVPVASVVRDYRVLRETLASVWGDETGNSPLVAETWIRVHQILDDFIVQAVDRYSQDESQYRQELERIVGMVTGPSPELALPVMARRALETIESAVCLTFYRYDGQVVETAARACVGEALAPDEARALRALHGSGPLSFDDGRVVLVPLRHGEETVGVAEIVTRQRLREHDRLLFRALSNEAAASIAAGRMARRESSLCDRVSELAGELDAVYAHAPVGLAHLDDQGRLMRVNEAFAHMSGRPASELVSRGLSEVFPPATGCEAMIREVLASGTDVLDLEVSSGRPEQNGSDRRFWLLSYYPVAVGTGPPRGVGLVARDVTHERSLAATLTVRARQQQAAAELGIRALQTSDLGSVFEDAVATVTTTLGTDFSKILERLPGRDQLLLKAGAGWNPGLVGRHTVDAGLGSQAGYTLLQRKPVIVDDVRTERRFGPPALLVEHGVVSGVSVVIEAPEPATGVYGVLSTHSRSRRHFTPDDGAFLQAVANVVGASILRSRFERTVEIQRRWGEMQRLLADVSAAFAGSLDSQDALTYLPRLLAPRLASHIAVLVPGQGAWRTQACFPVDTENLCARIEREFAAGGPVAGALAQGTVVRWNRDSGGTPPGASELLAPSGMQAAALLPIFDQTVLVALLVVATREGSLSDDERTLAEEVSRRIGLARQNARLYREAKEAIRAREEILAVVSHDLKTPLSTVLLTAHTLLDQIEAEQTRRPVEAIRRAATRMGRMIDDLLDFDSLRSGRLKVVRQSVDPNQLLEEARDSFAVLVQRRGLQLVAKPRPGLPPIRCDRERILQAISNLMINAANVTAPGGKIQLQLSAAAEGVVFAVEDTGPGLTKEDASRIFERYWRGRSAVYKGTGLGLAIVRGLVEAHGGRVWAESEMGRGSRFCFSLPV